MKVIILAGGLGSRLCTVVKDMPKPMAEIDGTPFLEIIMDNMVRYGATEFILCVSYLRDKITSYFGNEYKGCSIRYSVEDEPLGTGGAIKQAFDLFHIEDAIVMNGDSFIQMDYADFYKKNRCQQLSIALKHIADASRYGLVETQGKYILRFHEKSAESKAGLINAGIYFINKSIWKYAPKEAKFSFEKNILEGHINTIRATYYKTEDYFIDIGIPDSYARANRELKQVIGFKNKALFLDRDGVINVDKHHVYKVEDCEFIEGIFDLCRQAKSKGYKLIVVTNQAGIAKGIYTEEDYFKFREYVHAEFKKQGCQIDAEYYCPYHIEGLGKYKKDSEDRKPNPGMILKAAKDFNLDLSQSILIGDKESDIEAGRKAGVGRCFLTKKDANLLLTMTFEEKL